MKKVYYIETTLNGYITKEIEIVDWGRHEDLIGKVREFKTVIYAYLEIKGGE